MHVVRNNNSIWVAIVETEEEPTSTSSEWALMMENADEQAVIAIVKKITANQELQINLL
jgi:hypothetical protein